jgi:hypothetical protein
MRSLKPVASDASSTAPVIAVPRDDPILGRALEPARLAGLGGRDSAHDHVPELRGQQAGAGADGPSATLKPVSLRVRSSITSAPMLTATSPICATTRGKRRAAIRGPKQREHEHRRGQREQTLAGLERVKPKDDVQEHRDDEERAHQDELLTDQRREPRAKLRDAQQRRVEQRASRAPVHTTVEVMAAPRIAPHAALAACLSPHGRGRLARQGCTQTPGWWCKAPGAAGLVRRPARSSSVPGAGLTSRARSSGRRRCPLVDPVAGGACEVWREVVVSNDDVIDPSWFAR